MSHPLEKLWIGKATIYEYVTVTDPVTFQSTQYENPVVVNEPCRLSYNREHATDIKNGTAVISQSVTLFIRPDLDIKEGSVIDVTQHGRTVKYKGSSKTAVYSHHQEVVLELYEDRV